MCAAVWAVGLLLHLLGGCAEEAAGAGNFAQPNTGALDGGIASCDVSHGRCDSLQTCTDTADGVLCADACEDGYAADSERVCRDVDECAADNGGCDPLAACVNLVGSYECGACPEGYRGHGSTGCDDVDECSRSFDPPCDELVTCTNTPGGYECGACPEGYGDSGSGCEDVDECAGQVTPCDPLATCQNTVGSYECGACPAGYVGDGLSGCEDVDECLAADSPCEVAATCQNLPGSYVCGACPPGYVSDGAGTCVDVDECAVGTAGCDGAVSCQNLPGTFRCGSCPEGYLTNADGVCLDPEACSVDNGGCDPVATCSVEQGVVLCGDCPAGYVGSGVGGCVDIDECLVDHGGCDPVVTCTNTEPGRICGACPVGYTGDGEQGCRPAITALTIDDGAVGLSPAFAPTAPTFTATSGRLAASTAVFDIDYPVDAELWVKDAPVAGVPQANGLNHSRLEISLQTGTNSVPLAVVVPASGERRDYSLQLNRKAQAEPSLYIKAPNAGVGDRFGAALASSGAALWVGAPGEASNGTTQGDDSLGSAGAVYLYERSGSGDYRFVQYLKADSPSAGAEFGAAVAAEGAWVAVGSPGESSERGAVYLFQRTGVGLQRVARLTRSSGAVGDRFGSSVALAYPWLLVGAPEAAAPGDLRGAATLFAHVQGQWVAQRDWSATHPAESSFGHAVTVTLDAAVVFGSTGLATYSLAGGIAAAPVRTNLSLVPLAGATLGDELVIGLGRAALRYRNADGYWSAGFTDLTPDGAFDLTYGAAVAASTAVVAVSDPGDNSAAGQVNGARDQGPALADAGAVYLAYLYASGSTPPMDYLKAPNPGAHDGFGKAVVLAPHLVAVGAPGEDGATPGIHPVSDGLSSVGGDGLSGAGAVYIYR